MCSAGHRLQTTAQPLRVLLVEVVAVQADPTGEGIESLSDKVTAHLRWPLHLANHAVQHMTRHEEVTILFTASIAGEMVEPREPSLPKSRLHR